MFLNWECPAISSFLDCSFGSLVLGLLDLVAEILLLGSWVAGSHVVRRVICPATATQPEDIGRREADFKRLVLAGDAETHGSRARGA
jgi:hypothetical protein